MKNLEILKNFDIDSLPDLDVVVLGALELFMEQGIPELHLGDYKRPLVLGSVNAAVTGEILFDDKDVVLADESSYQKKIKSIKNIDGAILISASGSKHAVSLAKDLRERGIETRLLTNNVDAPAKEFIDEDKVFVFPKNREPYTYNTSTYLGMILGKTKENPLDIKQFIEDHVDLVIPQNFKEFDAYYVIIPKEFAASRELFLTKFDEMFQPMISGRVFTEEQSKHAKTVIISDKELFISFGYDNQTFGLEENRLFIPLPENADYGALMVIVYYVLGKIQAQHPPYFKDGIQDYMKKAGDAFGITLSAIVE